MFYHKERSRGAILSRIMSDFPAGANLRSGVIHFSACRLIVVNPFLDQAFAPLGFGVMYRGTMPNKASRAAVGAVFIACVMLLSIMHLFGGEKVIQLDQRGVG